MRRFFFFNSEYLLVMGENPEILKILKSIKVYAINICSDAYFRPTSLISS